MRRQVEGRAPRLYVYYRCTGTNAGRFGGQRLCHNRPVNAERLEAAVWDDVCALLADPGKVEEEYQRRFSRCKVVTP